MSERDLLNVFAVAFVVAPALGVLAVVVLVTWRMERTQW